MFRKETLPGLVETWETKANEMLQGMVMNTGKLTVVTIRAVVAIKVLFITLIFMKYQVTRGKINTTLGTVLY